MLNLDLLDRIDEMSDTELYSRYDEVSDLIDKLTEKCGNTNSLDKGFVFDNEILDLIQERDYINEKFIMSAVKEKRDIITPWEKRHWNDPFFRDVKAVSSYNMTIHTIFGEIFSAAYQVFPNHDVEIYILKGERYYSVFKISMTDDEEWQTKIRENFVENARWWHNINYKTIVGMPANYGILLNTTNLLVSPNPTVGDMHNYAHYQRQVDAL